MPQNQKLSDLKVQNRQINRLWRTSNDLQWPQNDRKWPSSVLSGKAYERNPHHGVGFAFLSRFSLILGGIFLLMYKIRKSHNENFRFLSWHCTGQLGPMTLCVYLFPGLFQFSTRGRPKWWWYLKSYQHARWVTRIRSKTFCAFGRSVSMWKSYYPSMRRCWSAWNS